MLPLFLFKKNNVVADIYISANGNDSNPGTYLLPIKTIAKLNTLLVSNKIIAFAKGGTYEGKININGLSGLTFISYGSGNKPILTSGKLLTGLWTQNGNIWSYQDDNFPSEITNVLQGSTPLALGRWPKANTQLPIHTLISDTFVRDTVNSFTDGHWDNAQIVCYVAEWICQVLRVTNYASNQYNFPSKLWYTETTSTLPFGYCIQNHVNCLTVQGEWAYNNITKILYIYSTSQPNNILVTYGGNIIDITSSTNIVINGLNFNASNKDVVNIRSSNGVTLKNCNISNSGRDVVNVAKSTNIYVQNNIATNTGRDFFHTPEYSQYTTISAKMADLSSATTVANTPTTNIEVSGNRSNEHGAILGKQGIFSTQEEEGTNVGQVQGLGCFVSFCQNVNIYNNHFLNSCYNGIEYKVSGNVNVYNNWVDNPCMFLSDGGAIYGNGMNTYWTNYFGITTHTGFVYNNILTNLDNDGFMLAKPAGADKNSSKHIFGIYMDDAVDSQEIHDNYIDQCHVGCVIKDYNNVYNNTFNISYYRSAIGLYIFNGLTNISTFQNNIFIVSTIQTGVYLTNDYYLGIPYSNSTNYRFKNNKYYAPFDNPTTNTGWNNGGASTFTQWLADNSRINWDRTGETQLTPSQWLNSTKPQTDYMKVLLNTTNVDMVVSSSSLPYSDYIDLTGADFGTSRTIQPYGSLIIVRKEN